MGGVSPVLRGSGVPQGSCELGQHQRGIQEAAMAERGKERLTVVVLCFFTSVLKRRRMSIVMALSPRIV